MIRYRSIKKEALAEQIIERSRFIAHVRPVETKEQALDFFEEIRSMHKTATHNVPAYVIGEKSQLQWASDDGEPQGTSGAPIVQMLVKEGITNIAVIVTRYFGGIKLGTGGLVRAYTGSAKAAVEAAGVCNVQEMNTLSVKLDYSFWGKLQSLADNGAFAIGDVIYEDKVIVDLTMEPEKWDEVMSMLSNLTGGQFTELGSRQELIKT
ncbi:MAG: YigZ family protein [Clostridiales bacterium]|nr:YigZ family protein [Clostridiales bacterium]